MNRSRDASFRTSLDTLGRIGLLLPTLNIQGRGESFVRSLQGAYLVAWFSQKRHRLRGIVEALKAGLWVGCVLGLRSTRR